MIQHSGIFPGVRTKIPFGVYNLDPSLTNSSEELTLLLTRHQVPSVEELVDHIRDVATNPDADDPHHFSYLPRSNLYFKMKELGCLVPSAIKSGNPKFIDSFEKHHEEVHSPLFPNPGQKGIRVIFAALKGYGAKDLMEYHILGHHPELYDEDGGLIWKTDYPLRGDNDAVGFIKRLLPTRNISYIFNPEHFTTQERCRITKEVSKLVSNLEDHFESLADNSYGVMREVSFRVLDHMCQNKYSNFPKPKTPVKLSIVR